MIPFVENSVELVADFIDEPDTTPTRTTGVDDEVLRSIFGAHTDQWDSEDLLLSICVARVGRREVVHGHGEVAAFQGMTFDLSAMLPRHTFALVCDSSRLMARNSSQWDMDMRYESI